MRCGQEEQPCLVENAGAGFLFPDLQQGLSVCAHRVGECLAPPDARSPAVSLPQAASSRHSAAGVGPVLPARRWSRTEPPRGVQRSASPPPCAAADLPSRCC